MSWLLKQFLKRGPGSPGGIGKTVTNKYASLVSKLGYSSEEACSKIVSDYFTTYRSLGQPLAESFEEIAIEVAGNNPVMVSYAITIVAQRGDSGKNNILHEKSKLIFDILNERFEEGTGVKSPYIYDSEIMAWMHKIHLNLSPSFFY
jgi:hypothetical protein